MRVQMKHHIRTILRKLKEKEANTKQQQTADQSK